MENVRKVYDLEERTYLFAKNVRVFVKELEKVPVPYIKGKNQNWKED